MPNEMSDRYLLLYGSQTGQARAIAEEIFQRSSERGLQPDLHCLSMVDKKFSIEKERCVVLVTSTTGDGEPPDTALKFVRRINKKTLPDDFLSELNYTVLGLGDTNYSNFCNNARNIDRRLSQLGGQRFYPCGFADDAVGLEVVVDPWMEGLFPALQAFLNVSPALTVPVVCVSADCTASQPAVAGADSPQGKASDGLQNPAVKAASQSSTVSVTVTVEKPESLQSPGGAGESDGPQSPRAMEESENGRMGASDGSQSPRTTEESDGPRTEGGSESTRSGELDASQKKQTKSSESLSRAKSEGSGPAESRGSIQESESPAPGSVTDGSDRNRTSGSLAPGSVTDGSDRNRASGSTTENVTPAENCSTSGVQTDNIGGISGDRFPSPGKTQELGLGTSGEATHGTVSGSQFTGESNVDSLLLNKPCVEGPSLGVSVLPLSESALTLPAATPPFLTVTYLPPDQGLPEKLSLLPWQNNCKPPSAASDIVKAKVVTAQQMTTEDALKKTLLLRFNIEKSGMKYQPGDSISVICANHDREVSQLITRLGLISVADLPMQLGIVSDTKKRRAAVPPHIPEEGASLRYILKNCVDIREPPKKALLRLLVDHTRDASEKRRLQELCSKEGAEDYAAFVRAENVSLLDVLYTFTSCQPPVERLIELLPRLQPRPYSACSCEDWRPGHVDIAFNVVDIPSSQCRLYSRRGLCTGWLDDITQPLQRDGKGGGDVAMDLVIQMESVSLEDVEVQIFSRTNQNFHPPSDLSVPLIMIGPGTGVAPYIGFLQERQLRLEQEGGDKSVGETWLLFGCRHKERDFLFRTSVKAFQRKGVLTKFLPAFSRDVPDSHDSPRYVQDNIRAHASEIYRLIHEKEAVVFVCGDAKNMAKDVSAAIENVIMQEQGLSADDAKTYVMKMRIHRHYLEDVWT